jgi:hypothetical protein
MHDIYTRLKNIVMEIKKGRDILGDLVVDGRKYQNSSYNK